MARKKKIMELDLCPIILQKVITVMDKAVDDLSTKESLTSEDLKNLVALSSAVSGIYKEYRAELKAIKQELSSMTKEQLLALGNIEGKN